MKTVFTTSTGSLVTEQLKGADGKAINLTGYSVKFFMREGSSETLKVNNKAATIVDAASGKVSYAWKTADIDTPGEFYGWWYLSKGTEKTSTNEFLVVVDEHGPGMRARTGAIYNRLQGFLPLTVKALRENEEYGDSRIQDRIEECKKYILASAVAVQDEGDLDIRVQAYLAKCAALEIIPPGVDYWAQQHISVTTGGGTTNEIATYPDRIAALWKIYERFLIEVKEEAATIAEIVGSTPNFVPSFAIPEVSDGAATDVFVTPNPSTDFREYSFPGKRSRDGWSTFFRGWN